MAMKTDLSAPLSEHVSDDSIDAAHEQVDGSQDRPPRSRRNLKPPPSAGEAASTAPEPRSLPARLAEKAAQRLGYKHLLRLAEHRGDVARAFDGVPKRMHLVANQTQLLLELIDDFRTGTYREIPWRSVFVASAAVLYSVSPADLIPDMLLGVGFVDDLAVIAVATRLIEKDLKAYCRFKGYSVEEYFGKEK